MNQKRGRQKPSALPRQQKNGDIGFTTARN